MAKMLLILVFLICLIDSSILKSAILDEKVECECLQSKIKFDASSLEKIILHPENILYDPDAFWSSDSAYRLVKLWHQEISLPIPIDQWKTWIQSFQNSSVEERKKNPQLIAATQMIQKEVEFNKKAIPYLCSFLPKDVSISTTIYFTTAIMASGFQSGNSIVIYGANADKDNMLIHELFHQGFNNCKPTGVECNSIDSRIYKMYNDLQNEGMATYIGYMALKEFPNCRTDMLKDDYKLFENLDDLNALLDRINELFMKVHELGEKELKDSLWQLGSMERAYYVIGCYMAKVIDEKSGRLSLIETITDGSQSFLNKYNSLVDDKLKVVDMFDVKIN